MRAAVKIFFAAFLLGSTTLAAQDVHFSMTHRAPLLLNPALAGAQQGFNAVLNFKEQWSPIGKAYSTAQASLDLRLNRDEAAAAIPVIGLSAYSDLAGEARLKTLHVLAAAGCHLKTGENGTIGAALSGGFIQRSIDYSGLTWGSQFDGFSYNPAYVGEAGFTNSFVADINAGLVWTHKKGEMFMTSNDHHRFLAGLSVSHVNQPKDWSFSGTNEKLNMRIAFHGEGLIGLKNTPLSLEPAVAYFRQGELQELLAGSMIWYTLKEESKVTGYVKGTAVAGGLHWRNKDALIAALAFRFDRYSIGFSYDVNTSSLRPATSGRGGFELFLRMNAAGNFLWKKNSKFN